MPRSSLRGGDTTFVLDRSPLFPTPDKHPLSLLPVLKCTATLSLALAEIQPYWAAETGITPFRRISNLPASPTGTSTVAFIET